MSEMLGYMTAGIVKDQKSCKIKCSRIINKITKSQRFLGHFLLNLFSFSISLHFSDNS